MEHSSARATLMLVLVTLLWGLSFPLMKSWHDAARDTCPGPGAEALSTATLIGLRMVIAVAILAAVRPGLARDATRREHAVGLAVGLAFFVGSVFQVWGLAYTTPARSAFITSLCSAWVPLIAWAFLRTPPAPVTLAGLALGLAGTASLSLDFHESWSLGVGEGQTAVSSVLFAVQILVLDRLGRRVRSSHLTVAFLGITGLLAGAMVLALAASGAGLAAWWDWVGWMFRQPLVLRDFVLVTLLPTVLSFHWMNVYQPRVSAGRAALIYLLEPVFASLFSVLWGQDQVTLRLVLGGSLILLGNLLIEVPYWLRRMTADRPIE
jgi:drug/metabolite transporter (DMT)-like permease